jgi:hypothetical protein
VAVEAYEGADAVQGAARACSRGPACPGIVVQNMVRWGNKRANEYWEAHVPEEYYIPDENDSVATVERWIRDKYEKKRFASRTQVWRPCPPSSFPSSVLLPPALL